ncbi:DUF3325 domain-containing protein [Shewanella amazonensis]|uniref:DUF3325 domain-containing protein n=1 Tax=Shewanella amazonensis (strain ATCC BAA-1098 / SB2B) TaxID=326297 RepID=A1SB57_SHEAM|nr:DUF3325 domain-containing protein [Shewanella amazonensis]ABM01614.1 hypothetical protein Sama_3411 [Shewanella amazonensis SB2B]
MMALALFFLSFGSFGLLAASQFGHHRTIFGVPPSDTRARWLQVAGLGMLALGMALAIALDGGYGLILLITLMAPAALGQSVLLNLKPRALRLSFWLAPAALLLLVLAVR